MPLPKPAKGTRIPGSGRKRGTPNRITVEARTLAAQLVNDPDYQEKLRADFRRRRVHPTIESLMWQFHIGKPAQPIAIAGALALDVGGRLEEERRIFAQLDVAELEQLAAESQALVDRAAALAKARTAAALGPVSEPTPQDVVIEAEAEDRPSESLGKSPGSDT